MKNRRKACAVFLLAISLFAVSPKVYAGGPVEKFARGVQNIVFAPKEFLTVYDHTSENKSFFVAVAMTAVYGTVITATRVVVGAYEAATFFIPIPRGYEPVMDPPTP